MSEHVRCGLGVGMTAVKCDGVCVCDREGLRDCVSVSENRRWRPESGRGGRPGRARGCARVRGVKKDTEIASIAGWSEHMCVSMSDVFLSL